MVHFIVRLLRTSDPPRLRTGPMQILNILQNGFIYNVTTFLLLDNTNMFSLKVTLEIATYYACIIHIKS